MANRELIVATLAAVEDHPEHHDQSTWACQTGMCFAGWAAAISGWRFELAETDDLGKRNAEYAIIDGERIFFSTRNFEQILEIDSAWVDRVVDHRHTHNCREDCDIAFDDGGEWLFGADNTLDDLYRICAELLGETEEELRAAVEKQRDYDPVPDLLLEATVDPDEAIPFDTVEVSA